MSGTQTVNWTPSPIRVNDFPWLAMPGKARTRFNVAARPSAPDRRVVLVVARDPGPRAARLRSASYACRGAFAVLLTALAAGCTTSNSSNASLTTSGASGPSIAFESIDGPPVGVFNRLVDNLSTEAQARQVAIASREGAANYRVRGYLAAQVVRGRTHISWVWDVYDDDRLRALRITGEEAGGRGGSGGSDPWGVADEQMVRRIARASMDRLTAFLGNPAAPQVDDSPAIAAADAPEPARKRQRRAPRSASAAEMMALASTR